MSSLPLISSLSLSLSDSRVPTLLSLLGGPHLSASSTTSRHSHGLGDEAEPPAVLLHRRGRLPRVPSPGRGVGERVERGLEVGAPDPERVEPVEPPSRRAGGPGGARAAGAGPRRPRRRAGHGELGRAAAAAWQAGAAASSLSYPFYRAPSSPASPTSACGGGVGQARRRQGTSPTARASSILLPHRRLPTHELTRRHPRSLPPLRRRIGLPCAPPPRRGSSSRAWWRPWRARRPVPAPASRSCRGGDSAGRTWRGAERDAAWRGGAGRSRRGGGSAGRTCGGRARLGSGHGHGGPPLPPGHGRPPLPPCHGGARPSSLPHQRVAGLRELPPSPRPGRGAHGGGGGVGGSRWRRRRGAG